MLTSLFLHRLLQLRPGVAGWSKTAYTSDALLVGYTANSLSLSLQFNGHFPGGPGLAGTRMFPF